MDEAYFNRMEALEFAVHHDDGQACHLYITLIYYWWEYPEVQNATSIYLANRGYKVANYPLVPGIAPPIELMQNKNACCRANQ